MKLVLAHDYLIQMGGAERVVAAMHRDHPRAPIYTSAVARKTLWEDFADADIRTTWMQNLPGMESPTHFKKYLPLYPLAFRSLGPLPADRAWISSSTFAKYLRFPKDTHTVCYVHNPTRFLWQTDEYLDHEVGPRFLNRVVRAALPAFRRWDIAAARRMKVLVANSRNVQARIRACYSRDAIVIPPPVSVDRFPLASTQEDFDLIVSRLLGYKNVGLAVRVCNALGRRLVVIGEGPEKAALQRLAGPTVEIVGRLGEAETLSYFQRCRGLIFPGHEDFGITPVEAMACGKPVVALARGGALETVVDGKTGLFFAQPTGDDLAEALRRLDDTVWEPGLIRAHAEQFSEAHFLRQMSAVLEAREEVSTRSSAA